MNINFQRFRNLRVTVAQVYSWLENGGKWPSKFTDHHNFNRDDWAIVYYPAGEMWSIELGRSNNNDRLIDVIRPDSKEYLEILTQPTSFAHALECMEMERVVFAWHESILRIASGEIQIYLDGCWVDDHVEVGAFIGDASFILRPDIGWLTGEIGGAK